MEPFKTKMQIIREKCVALVQKHGPQTATELTERLGEKHLSTVSMALALCKELRPVKGDREGKKSVTKYTLVEEVVKS